MRSPLLRRAFSGAFIGFLDQPELDAPSQNLKSEKLTGLARAFSVDPRELAGFRYQQRQFSLYTFPLKRLHMMERLGTGHLLG